MQSEKIDEVERIGEALRLAIKEHKVATGCTYRHLSRTILRDDNYIASYLSQPAVKWAIPKHPTYGLLLAALQTSESILLTPAENTAGDLT